jgi:hypothetical protein
MRIFEIVRSMEQSVLPVELKAQLELLLEAISDWPI